MSNSYQSVKRKYFSALNIGAISEPITETSDPTPIPLPGGEFETKNEYSSPLSCPIDISAPEGQNRNNLKSSGGSFIPPHLYALRGREDSFSVYDYEKKRLAGKRAY